MTDGVPSEQLLVRFAGGDTGAFEELLGRYERPVFRFVRRLLNDVQLAEDVHQEVFLRVIHHAARFRKDQKAGPWIFRVARNLCIDTMRREGYRRAASLDGTRGTTGGDDAPSLGEALPGSSPAPESGAIRDEQTGDLEIALAGLPDDQREVVLLKEVAGLTFREMADVTGQPASTLKSRMRAALETLRHALRRHADPTG